MRWSAQPALRARNAGFRARLEIVCDVEPARGDLVQPVQAVPLSGTRRQRQRRAPKRRVAVEEERPGASSRARTLEDSLAYGAVHRTKTKFAARVNTSRPRSSGAGSARPTRCTTASSRIARAAAASPATGRSSTRPSRPSSTTSRGTATRYAPSRTCSPIRRRGRRSRSSRAGSAARRKPGSRATARAYDACRQGVRRATAQPRRRGRLGRPVVPALHVEANARPRQHATSGSGRRSSTWTCGTRCRSPRTRPQGVAALAPRLQRQAPPEGVPLPRGRRRGHGAVRVHPRQRARRPVRGRVAVAAARRDLPARRRARGADPGGGDQDLHGPEGDAALLQHVRLPPRRVRDRASRASSRP